MGTRADFYIGRGVGAEWLGSIAWDGYPDGIAPPVLRAKTAPAFRAALSKFFKASSSTTLPEQGWPWPWENSQTTDYAYAFDEGLVWASNFSHGWWKAREEQPEREEDECKVEFPDMKARQKVTLGPRSGVLIISR